MEGGEYLPLGSLQTFLQFVTFEALNKSLSSPNEDLGTQ